MQNNVIMNQTKRLIAVALFFFLTSNASFISAKPTDEFTGICLRRITALNSKGIVVNRYETIIIKQSSSLSKDIDRVKMFTGDSHPLNDPDIKPFVWISAAISDAEFNEDVNFGCSKLPNLRAEK